MIFNRYLVVFFAGLQSLSQAASLRKGAGGRRLTVEAEFNGLVQLLNTTYDGSCKIHTTGEYDPLATPMTHVYCSHPGGYARMLALGGFGETSVTASRLRVCEVQVDEISKCSNLHFTGDARTDLEDAAALLKGLLTARSLSSREEDEDARSSTFDWMVKALNSTYGGTCQLYVVGDVEIKGHTEVMTTFVDCTTPGGSGYLDATGYPPRVRSLEACSYGDEMKETCRTAQFSGNEKKDKEEFFDLMGSKSGDARKLAGIMDSSSGSSIVGTDFDLLVELLNGLFGNQCETTVVGLRPLDMTISVSCTRPGGRAKLAAIGSTDNPTPNLLQVCAMDKMKPRHCRELKLTGDTTKDLPAAKKMLRFDWEFIDR